MSHHHLWRHITGSPAECLQLLGTILQLHSESEVNQLDIVVLEDHNILQLEVSMDYILAVEVMDSGDDQSSQTLRHGFFQSPLRFSLEVLQESDGAGIFHD